MNTRPTLFVTGASGHLGRQAVEFLLASGKGKVIAGSRDPEKLADLVAKGAEARAVDFNCPETLTTAFEGVDRLLIVSTDAIDEPGRRLIQHTTAINAARSAGVKHIVFTSATNASRDSASMCLRDHHETEQALIASGLGHTILRNTLYVDLLLMSLPQILASGQWFHAAYDGKDRVGHPRGLRPRRRRRAGIGIRGKPHPRNQRCGVAGLPGNGRDYQRIVR